MANGDDLKIGGFKDLSMQSIGNDAGTIGTTPITLPNSDYNSFQANRTNNQTQFLGLTAQHTTTPFNSRALDMAFGTRAGLNGLNKEPILTPEQGNSFIGIA